ncbi:hypothetical protein AV551_06855 [Salmonella enterica]|nr:hypothetical protein [Salmonella enterica]
MIHLRYTLFIHTVYFISLGDQAASAKKPTRMGYVIIEWVNLVVWFYQPPPMLVRTQSLLY